MLFGRMTLLAVALTAATVSADGNLRATRGLAESGVSEEKAVMNELEEAKEALAKAQAMLESVAAKESVSRLFQFCFRISTLLDRG